MTLSAGDKQISPEKLSALIAAAAVLQISESMLPHPVPGLRIGLANIVSLIVLFQYGFKAAMTVTLLRSVVSSLVLGSFLSPGFILSFTAGFVSISVIGLFYKMSAHSSFLRLSPIGYGIIGAFVHNMIQMGLAYFIFFHHPGILIFIPWMIFGSVVIGFLTGSLTIAVLNRLAQGAVDLPDVFDSASSMEERIYIPSDSILHRCSAEIKILVLLLVTLLTVFFENLVFYTLLLALILVLIPVASIQYKQVFAVVKKLWALFLSVFFIPLVFNYGTDELIATPFGPIHQEAVVAGLVFSSRLILLALFSNLLARTTSTESFTQGLYTFLKVFNCIGLNSKGVAETVSHSLTCLPNVWLELRSALQTIFAEKPKNYKGFKEGIVLLFLYFFRSSGRS